MCAFTLLGLLAVVFGVPLILFWHLSIRSSQLGGHVSGVYRLNVFERFVEIFPILYIAFLVGSLVTVEGAIKDLERTSLRLFGSGSVLSTALLWGPLIMWAISRGIVTYGKVCHWLALQGIDYSRVRYLWIGSGPWTYNSKTLSSGVSNSQSVYKVTTHDAQGNVRIAFVLWGGYWGMEWLTGEVPVELVWEGGDEAQRRLYKAAERTT